MAAEGLLALLAKPKGAPSEEAEAPADGGAEAELAGEAFDAFKDGDREGFVSAFLSAVRACARKAGSGGYEGEESEF